MSGSRIGLLEGSIATGGDASAGASARRRNVERELGGAQFAVSATGTLVYLPGQSTSGGRPIRWMTHEGKTTPLRATPANWFNPHFAPDGRRLAVELVDGSGRDVWVYEWARDTLTRLTFDPADDRKPVWTPDGRRIAFASARADKSTLNLYWQRADGTGDAQRLTESKNRQLPASWHPSGKFLAFEESNSQTDYEGPGGKWQISTGGGAFPIWSRAKHELFYGAPSGRNDECGH